MSHYKTLSKRGLALVLALVMLFTLLPISVLAEEGGDISTDPQPDVPQDAGIISLEALSKAVDDASEVSPTTITLSASFSTSNSIGIGSK